MSRPDAADRRREVTIAGHSGDTDAARSALSDPDERVRAAALTALARLGVLTPADLEAALGDPVPSVRRRACELAAVVPAVNLQRQLTDSDSTVVEAAAWAAGEQKPPHDGIVEALCSVASDHDDALARESAVAALGAIGDRLGVPAILAALKDKAPVRRRAVLALAPFEGPDIEAAISDALDDRDWQVRQAAEDMQPES